MALHQQWFFLTRRPLALAYITKPGKHGTLYLYRIVYRNDGPDDLQRFTWRTYAYDTEHALNKFYDGPADDGWKAVSIARAQQQCHLETTHDLE